MSGLLLGGRGWTRQNPLPVARKAPLPSRRKGQVLGATAARTVRAGRGGCFRNAQDGALTGSMHVLRARDRELEARVLSFSNYIVPSHIEKQFPHQGGAQTMSVESWKSGVLETSEPTGT